MHQPIWEVIAYLFLALLREIVQEELEYSPAWLKEQTSVMQMVFQRKGENRTSPAVKQKSHLCLQSQSPAFWLILFRLEFYDWQS